MRTLTKVLAISVGIGFSSFLGGCVEKTSFHNMEVYGKTGNVQYSGTVKITLTAYKLANVGDYANAINEYRPAIDAIVNNAAANLPATGGKPEMLEAELEAALEAQLPEIAAATYNRISADDVQILDALDYKTGANQSLSSFLEDNNGVYKGGSVVGTDSDNDGYTSGQASRKEVIPGQQDVTYLLCAVNGTGCKPNTDANTLVVPSFPQGGAR